MQLSEVEPTHIEDESHVIPLSFYSGEWTEASPFHEVNQDAEYVDEATGEIAVFDGLGGADRGDMASAIAKDAFLHRPGRVEEAGQVQIEAGLVSAWQNAKRRIDEFEQEAGIRSGRCATTVAVGRVYEEAGIRKFTFLHAGDSRLYVHKSDGTVEKMVYDESFLIQRGKEGELLREEAQAIDDAFDDAWCWTDVSRAGRGVNVKHYWDSRNAMSNALQSKSEHYTLQTIVLPEDVTHVFAVTDGYTDVLTARLLEHAFRITQNPGELVFLLSALVDIINADDTFAFRQKYDDKSLVMFALGSYPPRSPEGDVFLEKIESLLADEGLNSYRGLASPDAALDCTFEIGFPWLQRLVEWDLRWRQFGPQSWDQITKINGIPVSLSTERSTWIVHTPAVRYGRNSNRTLDKTQKSVVLVVEYQYPRTRWQGTPFEKTFRETETTSVEIPLSQAYLRQDARYVLRNRKGKAVRSIPRVRPVTTVPRSSRIVYEDGTLVHDFGRTEVK